MRYAITNRSKALYAPATLDMGLLTPALENLKLTGGYRRTWDKVSGTANFFGANPSPTPQQPGQFLCSATNSSADDPSQCEFQAVLKTNAPTWTVSLDYRVSPALLLYGKVSRGCKAGGINANAVLRAPAHSRLNM